MHMESFADYHRKKLPHRRSVALCYSECPKCNTRILFLFDFQNIESLCMHELLMKVARMRFESDFSAKVFVLRSIGNELVPSPHIHSCSLTLHAG